MKVLEVYTNNLPGNRTALKTDAKYTPYVICSNYDPEGKENQQWASSYGYYETFDRMCFGIVELRGCTIIDNEVVNRLSKAIENVRNIIKEEMDYGN